MLFQRGDELRGRCYHVVLCREENLKFLSEFGKDVLGYDIKQDFMSARFKTGLVTYSDSCNMGRAAVAGICNKEDEDSHILTFQIALANIPCNDENCSHPKELYLFNDQDGFFTFRPCALANPIFPIIQHDKALDIRNAVMHQNLKSTLCNFHALKAFRTFIKEHSELEMFIRPLETGFKCITRSWNKDMTRHLVDKFKHFILHIIPDNLMTQDTKSTFLEYIDRNWCNDHWSGTFTGEVFFNVPENQRRDPLILTDNITERKFKEIDETDFGSHLNRSIANLILKFLGNILYREGVQTSQNKNSENKVMCRQKSKELKFALSGINLYTNNKICISTDWHDSGWALVSSSINGTDILPEDFFLVPEDDDVNVDIAQPEPEDIHRIQTTSTSIVEEHGYSVLDGCKRLLSDLNKLALNIYHQENLNYLPNDLTLKLTPNSYICNIKLLTCTCFHFILRGQPYFCKHLYACLAMLHIP